MNPHRLTAAVFLIAFAIFIFTAPAFAATTPPGTLNFSENLKLGQTAPSVLSLQQFLNGSGFLLSTSGGAGSLGHETQYFGRLTFTTLQKFQAAHQLPATGFFGPLTRAVVNSIIAGLAGGITGNAPIFTTSVTSLFPKVTGGNGHIGSSDEITSSSQTITATSTPPDTTPPVISFISSGTPTTNAATITWTTNEDATSQVLYGTTSSYGSATSSAAFDTVHSLHITGLTPSTTYHYEVLSTDRSANTATSSDNTFTTDALVDNTPPTVAITDPTTGSTVSDSINIEANAADNVGVANVHFFVDGVSVNPPLPDPPYQIYWDTTTVADGSHVITAVAEDTAGNYATSTPITVTVNNAGANADVATEVFSQDFTSSSTLSNVFSFTRATPAWDYNASGTISQFATNTPMLNVYPSATTTDEGLGIWSLRTNQCLNSENPATQTRSITVGAWVVSIMGSGSVAVSGIGISGTATSGAPYIFDATTTTNVTFTPSGTVTHMQCERQTTNDVITVGDPTPPIVTTAAAVTRNADVITAPLYNLGVGTTTATYVVKLFLPTFSNITQVILDHNDGSINNGYRLIVPLSHRPTCELLSGGTVIASAVSSTVIAANTSHVVGCAFDQTGITVAVDGSTASTSQSNATTTYTQFNLGSLASAGNVLDGYIGYLHAWNGRLSDASLAILTAPQPVIPPGGYVYLETMGQSISNGAHATPALTTTPPFPTCAFMLNDTWGVRGAGGDVYTHFQTTGGVTGVTPAYETDGPSPPLTDYGETHISAWMSQLCSKTLSQAYIGRSDGASGHTIDELLPGTQPYINAIGEINTISNIVHLAAGAIRVGAVAFIHGQTDAQENNNPETYYTDELNLANSYNTDAKAATGQTQSIPFYEMQVAQSSGSDWNMDIAQSQYDIALASASSSPLFRLCSPSYMFPMNPIHQPHLINTSQQWQGEYLGNCYGTELTSGVPWKPLYPTSIAFNGSDPTKIEVALNVPVGPIAIDTTSLQQGAAPNDGLTFTDDCDDASITGVSVVDASHLEVQLSNAPACGHPLLQNAYTGPGATNISGAWSNIRDSNPAIGHTTGFHLYDWLVVFSLPVN